MAEQAVNVIFRGDIVLGQNLAEVKARFAQLFKLTPDKVDAYFSGRPVALKKACDQATAEKFKQALQQIGCLVQIKPVDDGAAAKPVATPAAQTPAAEAASAATGASPAAPVAAEPVANSSVAQAIDQSASAQPVAAVIDISHLSLVKRNPFSTEDEEPLEPPRVITPPNLDLSQYALEPVSDDWLEAARDVPELQLDLSAISLDEVGADLLHPDEVPVVEPVVVDVSGISIAATGADLGQILQPEPPPAPDTSHLSCN